MVNIPTSDIIKQITVKKTFGLTEEPDKFCLLWKTPGKKTDVLRWNWHPQTGDFYAGDVLKHFYMMPHGSNFWIWLRGFYFPHDNLIAIRAYSDPDMDEYELGRINRAAQDAIIELLGDLLPPFSTKRDVDNRWLSQTYYGRSW